MATRLDRLLLLLESGSTPVIRRSAAQQLGEVQRLHPHELNNLLSKVHAYLGNSQWDTRIAAGMAIEAIASNVDQWRPVGTLPTLSEDCEAKATSLKEDRLRIEHFNVERVLVCGSCLLGSHGAEYDVDDNVAGLDDKEKLRRQKEMMNKRLGLGIAGDFFQEELVKEEDFMMKQEPSMPHQSQSSIEDLISEQKTLPNKSEMSAREKNRAKRKAKLQAKQTTALEMDKKNGDASDGEPCCKKYKLSPDQSSVSDSSATSENVADNTLNMDEIEDWPFEQFCDLLMHDLFHAAWEKRHGAATGLREVVKLHGKGAGRSTDTPSGLMDLANQLWLEDLAVRLVCVLALDRFGDFVSDEVVAPVRETCAQTLGVTLRHMNIESVKQVLRILTQLLNRSEWEVQHGGLLGIKYLLAVRQDMTESLLSCVLPSICVCLEDPSDDVRAVAADALLPVTDALIRGFPLKVGPIVDTLWKILVVLDDLTSSTTSIMTLLSSVLSHPEVGSERYHQMLLTQLVPRLWPFLWHNITSVRRATLRTLSTLLSKSSEQTTVWLLPILSDALRHVYQRCLVESDPDLLHNIFQAWSLLLSHAPPEHLIGVGTIYFGSWMCLMMQPMIVAFDSSQMIETRHLTREPNPGRSHPVTESSSGETKDYIAGAMSSGASALERDAMVVRARRMAARLLGLLSTYVTRLGSYNLEGIPCSPLEALGKLFVFYLGSKAALQKMCTAYTITEWITLEKSGCLCPDSVKSKLHECLMEVVYYDEVAYLFTQLQVECRELIANIRLQGISLDPPFTTESVLTLENARSLCTSVFESIQSKIKPGYVSQLEDRRSSIRTIVTQATNELQILINRVQCSAAGAIICLKDLPEKMNPVVRPLMDALKREENVELQARAAASLAQLIPLCSSRSPCPISKIVRNLCTMLCSDPKYTPLAGKELTDNVSLDDVCCDKHNGILTLYTQRLAPEPTRGRRPVQRRPTVSVELSIDSSMIEETELARQHPVTQRRGGALALTAIAKEAGAELPEKVRSLWDAMWLPLQQLQADSESESKTIDESVAQEWVNSLQVLQIVAPAVHPDLHPQLVRSVELLGVSLRSSFTIVRHMTSRCLGVLCRLLPTEVMQYFINHILPWLSMPDSTVAQRQGCIEALALIIEQLSIDAVPFIVLLIVPVLGRMSDHDQSVRLLATNVFATLVRLLPLERSCASDDSSVVTGMMLEKQKDERRFLEQLLDGRKIDNFEVSVPLNVELRKYQQEGVNWLAFLARYSLHGILCDDMGLGKTLQSLCILATDHCKRELATKSYPTLLPTLLEFSFLIPAFKTIETLATTLISTNKQILLQPGGNGEETTLPPSIVVCPPTLTGHWLFEVEKLVGGKILRPLHYVGPPSERIRLQRSIQNYNLVLASYDVVRNDIDFFSKIKWNYCILDEGQIIKNSKTKISKAVKQLESNHRLILSGTPIQNNVLELWSLFDFLMPGFLGTEKQFQACFGRPILQSRDAKSSTKEQEAGTLAMEALHRQVLPFLLRRLKEDVLQDLPPKIVQDYYCDLSPLQIQLYEDFAKSQAAKKSVGSLVDVETTDDDSNKAKVPPLAVNESEGRSSMKAMHIFQALQYLRKVCNHPSLVLSPQHPEFSRVMVQLRNDNSSMHDLHHAPKLVALKQLLNDCGIGVCGTEAVEAPVVNQHRVLLFCQLKMMLDIVEQDLFRAHMPSVTYLRLDGSVPAGTRHQIVNRFNNDPSIDVLLLTTQVGGLGLNLTGADTVIFVEHDWNPMKDLQAMDRAHRIGQKKVVNVYRLITRGTLEEKIMGLQRFKINVANTVINQDNNSLASMGTNQLLDLFTVDRSTASEKQSTRTDSGDKSISAQPTKQSLRAILDGLDDLWDNKDYETEYNVNSFLSNLKNCK